MKKSKRTKQRVKKGKYTDIKIHEETDEINDEIDNFEAEYDSKLIKLVAKQKEPIAKEILRIGPDEEDDYSSQDEFEFANTTPDTISTNKWGKRRCNYYGTSFVDKDHGRINDSDEELLQLEEEDALARQKKLELANSCLDFDQLIGSNANMERKPLGEIFQFKSLGIIREDSTAKNLLSSGNKSGSDTSSNLDHNAESDGDCNVSRERRKITYEIRKNKGIPKNKGRKKGKQHSRVMKRIQYRKALIKKRSQVPDLKREIFKYDGEKRGIRISTIRSIKL